MSRLTHLTIPALQSPVRWKIAIGSVWQDSLFISLLVQLSLLLYVGRLGFYSDDWAFLGWMTNASDRTLSGLFAAIYSPQVWMRPVQGIYIAASYWFFGPNPLGYHLLNGLVLNATLILFYLCLREIGLTRLLAVAIPAVYGLLPHYSTERFWLAAFGYTLTMAAYFVSLLADLKAVQYRGSRFWRWRLVGLGALILSGLGYEVALPLFLLNPFLARHRSQQLGLTLDQKQRAAWKWVAILASNILAVALIVVFKVQTTIRLGNQTDAVGYFYWILRKAIALDYGPNDYGFNLKRALTLNFGDYGLRLPGVVLTILHNYANLNSVVLATLVGLLVFAYISRVGGQTKTGFHSWSGMVRLVVIGLVVFLLGYAIFLTNYDIQFTPTGIANRTGMAAAVGVAIVFVGAIGSLGVFLPQSFRLHFFALGIALLCASGLLINNTLASFWTEAYRQENAVLASIHREFPTLPSHGSLILDGICPYNGPAIVFESNWDLQGALMMYYRDPTLNADVVTPNLKVEEDGISTVIYGSNKKKYPYGTNLFIYDFRRNSKNELTDVEQARRYFNALDSNISGNCPPAHEGLGAIIF